MSFDRQNPSSGTSSRPSHFSQDSALYLLQGFAVKDDDSREFLASLVSSGTADREEVDRLYDGGLTAGTEDWCFMLRCAQSMCQKEVAAGTASRDGESTTLFSCLDTILRGAAGDGVDGARHSEGADDSPQRTDISEPAKRTRKRKSPTTSHFWGGESGQKGKSVVAKGAGSLSKKQKTEQQQQPSRDASISRETADTIVVKLPEWLRRDLEKASPEPDYQQEEEEVDVPVSHAATPVATPKKTRVVNSRFFTTQATPTKSTRAPSEPATQDCIVAATPTKTRPPPGTVSSLPFPPLSAPRFGLIQEELTHDPFQLLVAVRLLIKTKGTAAIPVFRQLAARWPTPQSLAAADKEEVLGVIRHLGLGSVRADAIQKYARVWTETPPNRDARYGVKNYPRNGDGQDVRAGEVFGPEDDDDVEEDDDEDEKVRRGRGLESAWEIGHITTGKYSIDSWRIFCRDVLLGRADDWKDWGRPPEFQPEWMRVLPTDKELRACLRWMWMREGWDWDPDTGGREVLSEELRRAVDEGRVGYDDSGRLQILTS